MKYAIIFFIALGWVLSLSVGLEYRCQGKEAFPVFYGSPFVFKRTSLGSSMEYFYSISGLLLNVLVWGVCFWALDKWIQSLISKLAAKSWGHVFYKILIVFTAVFSALHILLNTVMVGSSFSQNTTYWYWNMNKEAKDWGMTCKGEWVFFVK